MNYLNNISIKADNENSLSKKLTKTVKDINISPIDEFIQVVYEESSINIYINNLSASYDNGYWAYAINIKTKNKRYVQDLIYSIFHELGFFLSNSNYMFFTSIKIFDIIFTKPETFTFYENGFSFCREVNNFIINCRPTESELITCGIDEKVIKKIKYENTCKRILAKKERLNKALERSLLYKKRYEKSKVAYQNDISSLSDEEKLYLQLKGITL